MFKCYIIIFVVYYEKRDENIPDLLKTSMSLLASVVIGCTPVAAISLRTAAIITFTDASTFCIYLD